MGNETTTHSYCRKERIIAEIETDVGHLKRIVMTGNGGEALQAIVPVLVDSVNKLIRQYRWAISLLVTINLATLGGLITLIVKML